MSVQTRADEAVQRAKEHLEAAYEDLLDALKADPEWGPEYLHKVIDTLKQIHGLNERI